MFGKIVGEWKGWCGGGEFVDGYFVVVGEMVVEFDGSFGIGGEGFF